MIENINFAITKPLTLIYTILIILLCKKKGRFDGGKNA